MKVNIELDINEETLKDLMITALEGGSNYWCMLDLSNLPAKNDGEATSEGVFRASYIMGKTIKVFDVEEESGDPIGEITRGKIQQGTKLYVDHLRMDHIGHVIDVFIDKDFDAFDADAWFQFVTLGEITFG